LRPYQIATAAIFMLIAAVAMFDTRGGALPVSASGVPGGLRGGWYPFWAAAVLLVSAAGVGYQILRGVHADEGVFKGASGVLDLVKFVAPMVIATYLMSERLLGFYLASGAYTAYYSGVTARYRWYWSLLGGVLIALVTFFVFEKTFSALLPKSFLYFLTDGAFPF
jgi:tripartite tricarboxylate transporter TctB family protein